MKTDEFPTYTVIALIVMGAVFISLYSNPISSWSASANYENVSIDTRVNITHSEPRITSVVIDNGVDNITLNAGQTRSVVCNITVRDYNGYDDVNMTNATLWDDDSVNMGDVDDENNHYTNSSCTNVGNDGTYISYWECGFAVYYYANNGSNWKCNATAIDDYNFTDSNYNTTTINPLYALNVTQQIDYGNMAVGDTSDAKTANITNFGNMDLNISLFGYGGDNFAVGNGLSFICEKGNISVDNERYALNDIAWGLMTNLTNTSNMISDLTMPQRTDAEIINTTFWKLYVPPNPFGQCNGTVVFNAEVS